MFKFSIIRKFNIVKEVTSFQFYINSMYLKKKSQQCFGFGHNT